MRDVARWWDTLYNRLGSQKAGSSPTLFRAECGIWLAQYLGIAPKDLWGALSMLEWIDPGWSALQRQALAIARCYFPTGSDSWQRAYATYQEIDEVLRLYDLNDDFSEATPVAIPSGYVSERERFYRTLLSTPPRFNVDNKPMAKPGLKYHYDLRVDDLQVVYDFAPPDWWSNLSASTTELPRRIELTGRPSRDPLVISWQALQTIADFLDQLEQSSQTTALRLKPESWRQRLDAMSLRGFCEGGESDTAVKLLLDGVKHLPGRLAVGKSTLMTLVGMWCVLNGCQVTMVVGDVSSALAVTNQFNNWLLHPLIRNGAVAFPPSSTTRDGSGQPPRVMGFESSAPVAVPILGRTSRAQHIEQLARDTEMLAQQYHVLRAPHWGWRWLNTSCVLLADSQCASGDFRGPIPPGHEPCERLKPFEHATTDPQRQKQKRQQANDNDETGETETAYLCPLINVCPVRQADRDLVTAAIWVTTPQALTQSHAPRMVTSRQMTVYEMVYRHSDVVIVDECDAAQTAFDATFMPSETLAQPGGVTGLFTELVQEINNRGSLSTKDDSTRTWITAAYAAKALTEQAYDILTSPVKGKRIRGWIGEKIFSKTDLFAFITWLLMDISDPTELEQDASERVIHRDCYDALKPFIQNPDGTKDIRESQLLGPLAEIASLLGNTGHTADVKVACENWAGYAYDWARTKLQECKTSNPTTRDGSEQPSRVVANGIPRPPTRGGEDYWSSLAALVEFAVLVTVLDKRLMTIIVDWDSAPVGVTARYNRLRRWGRDLEIVLPPPPTGQVFGFQYTSVKGRPEVEGTLRYFQFSAVGRWLLIHFHDLFRELDGLVGPHTLLLSGTSWEPLSLSHVDVEADEALVPSRDGPALDQWQWRYTPVLRVSGTVGHERLARTRASGVEMARSRGAIRDILNELDQLAVEQPALWSNRQRVLVLTGSYTEAEAVMDGLISGFADSPNLSNGVYALARPGDAPLSDWFTDVRSRQLSKGSLRDQSVIERIKVLAAPMGSLGRAVNILNREGKAAFGSIMFVVRALRPPHDPETHARQLIYWIQRKGIVQTTPTTFGSAIHDLRAEAHAKWYELLTSDKPWRTMPQADRDELAAMVFTQTWQAAGRGIRGEVPVIVNFVDEAYGLKAGSVLWVMATCHDRYLAQREKQGQDITRDRWLIDLLYSAPITLLQNMLESPESSDQRMTPTD